MDRGICVGVVAALIVMAGCAGDGDATTTAPTTAAATTAAPTTAAPTTTEPATTAAATTTVATMSDLEVIEAGVAAFYSGDAERAAELFELKDRTDEQIRAESAYQAVIGGRLDLSCTETSPGSFDCGTPYRNAMTDAIGEEAGHDRWPVVVEDGVITQFGFTEHTGMLIDMATFLASADRFDGYEQCIAGPFPESCATIQMDNLDAWAAWHKTAEPADRVRAVVDSWYRGDCEAAMRLSWTESDCSPSSVPAATTAYESILGARVSVENCDTTPAGNDVGLSCEVQYSNAMNTAVDKPSSVTARPFVLMFGLLTSGPDEAPWYEADYPEDTELRDSFKRFAEGGELADQYGTEGCASARTPECANLIVGNLDAWATWHATNS